MLNIISHVKFEWGGSAIIKKINKIYIFIITHIFTIYNR